MNRLLLILLTLCTLPVRAEPDTSQRADFSVLTRAHSAYRFHTLAFVSADGLRHYRVYVGIPRIAAPSTGFPTLYALDGNALLEELNESALQQLAARKPTVLVLIGYATDKRFDAASRALDYTPSAADGHILTDAHDARRANGGGDEFLDILQQQIRPAVARLAPLNPQQQTLWGHSYGGLLVLHALFTRPQIFNHYVAADPSLWWQNGMLLADAKHFATHAALTRPTHLWLLKSGLRRKKTATTPQQQQRLNAHHRALLAVPEDATRQLATRLSSVHGLQVRYDDYPQHTHGSLLPAAFQAALTQTDSEQHHE